MHLYTHVCMHWTVMKDKFLTANCKSLTNMNLENVLSHLENSMKY